MNAYLRANSCSSREVFKWYRATSESGEVGNKNWNGWSSYKNATTIAVSLGYIYS